MKIAVVGLWHLGEIYSAGLAELGHHVVGISDDIDVIKNFKKNKPPLVEPNLSGLIKKHQQSGRLIYTTDLSATRQSDVVYFTFDTPVDKNDKADTSIIFNYLQRILPFLKKGVIIVVSSQLPVGTSQKVIDFIKKERPKFIFEYAYVPENLQLGKALESFFNPGRIVIGADDTKIQQKVQNIFKGIKAKFLIMNTASAEMVKHALNSFLATSLSFIYDIADVCEEVGADILDVSRALKSDSRIGELAYLDASIGFSGGTLGRDLQFLLHEAKRKNQNLPVISGVLKKNQARKNIVHQFLKAELGDFKNKKIVIAGLTYKAGTTTLRRSLALDIAREFNKKNAKIGLYDSTVVKKDIEKEISFPFFCENTFLSTLKDAHACVVITPWNGLKKVNFKKVRMTMKSPAILFDARNFLAHEAERIKKAGIYYKGVGRI